MSKFCTTCGTPLEETGACPKCSAAPAPEAAPAAATAAAAAENQYVAATKVAVKETIPFAKSYWKTPMEATKEVLAHKNTPLAVVLMVIYALVNGLLVHIIYSKFAGFMDDIVTVWDSSAYCEASLVANFVAGIVIAAVVLVVTVAIVFLVLKLRQVSGDWKVLLMAVGCNTVALTVALILTIVCIFLGLYKFAAVIFIINVILWMLLTILIPNQIFGVSYNGAAILAGSVAVVVAIYIVLFAGGKMHGYAVGSIETNEGTFSEFYEDIQDVEMMDVLEYVLEAADFFEEYI